jgi:uncharacterized protein YeaO (DUF488 family)
MPIRTQRIYDPATPDDGFRLLVMRLWPRGVRKERVSAWEKELGPSRALLDDFNHDRLSWEEYERRYLAEMAAKPDLLARWRERARGEVITLLCACKDAERCHRTLLKRLLESSARTDGTPR